MPTAYAGQPAYSSPEYGGGPVAWTAPENMSWDDISIIESEEGVIESGVGGSVNQPFNPAGMGIASYLANIFQIQFEITKQQEWNPKATEIGPEFEFTTDPPGDIITNPPASDRAPPSPNENFWGWRYDPSLLLPSNWMRTVREYLAEQEAKKPGGGAPVITAGAIKDEAAHVGEVGKDIKNLITPPTDPDVPFDIIAFLVQHKEIALGVGGLLVLIMIIK